MKKRCQSCLHYAGDSFRHGFSVETPKGVLKVSLTVRRCELTGDPMHAGGKCGKWTEKPQEKPSQ